MRIYVVAALMVATGFALVACGDGGPGTVRASDHSGVPDDSEVPDESGAPNDAEVPSGELTPHDGQTPPGATPPLGTADGNCARLCSHAIRRSCGLDGPREDCAANCTSTFADTPCALEVTSALLCLLDRGVCPEDEWPEEPQACQSAIQRYAACAGTNEGDLEIDETLD